MLIDNTNTNIPELSVGEVIKILTELYCNAIKAEIPLKDIPAPFLWGPFGVGKSAGIRQLAAALEKNTGKIVNVTDVRLLLFSPVDLRGVPVASADGFSDWLKPRIFDMEPSDECVNILFLDELSAAPQSVQAAAYQITLDRVIGEHKLPDNCIVIAAGNRTTDKSVSFAMPKALCNRLLHFSIRSDVASWIEWAYANRIDERIIGFIAFDNSRLNITPATGDFAFPTPRSWSFVSTLLKASNSNDMSDMHTLISSAVGIEAAVAFEEFCGTHEYLPDIDAIFEGTCTEYPKKQPVLYALISSLVTAVHERDITDHELENVCDYATRFPPDFAMTFYKDLSNIERISTRLMKVRSLQRWLSRNGRSL